MTIPHQPSPTSPAPKASEISAALAALGVYAMVPSEDVLADQAEAVGGEHVLAAVLANALYGAAIGTGMLTEGRMLEAGAKGRELGLCREQVLKASGAEGPAVMGVLHWQAGQIRQPLKAMNEQGAGPLVAAAARASSALLDLLACSAVFSTEDVRAAQVPEQLARARQDLTAALTELDQLPATTAAMFPDGIPG